MTAWAWHCSSVSEDLADERGVRLNHRDRTFRTEAQSRDPGNRRSERERC